MTISVHIGKHAMALPSEDRPAAKKPVTQAGQEAFWRDYRKMRRGEWRRERAQREALVNAYRRGSIDSASIQLALLRTIVNEPPSLAAKRKSAEGHGVIPTSFSDMASRYPLASIFAMGAIGGAVLTGSTVLGSRLARRTFTTSARQAADARSKAASTATTASSASSASAGKSATQAVHASQGDSSSVPLVPSLPSNWGEAQTASKDVVLRLDRLEKTILDHVQAANRDRRAELDIFRKEILGSLALPRPTPVISTDKPTGNGEVGATPAPKPKQEKKPAIGVGEVEKKLRDLEDLVVLANRDRRVELQGFRSEILGRLGAVEDTIRGDKVDVGEVIKSALDVRFGEAVDGGLGVKLEDKFANVEASVASLVGQAVQVVQAAQAKKGDDARPAFDRNTPPTPLERDFEAAKKDAVFDEGIQVPQEVTGHNFQPPASRKQQVKEELGADDGTLHSVASNMTSTTIGGKGAKAEQLAQEDARAASTLSTGADRTKGYTPDETAQSEEPVPAKDSTQDTIKGRISRSQRRRRRSATLVDPGPRIGIDDSGSWKFVLSLAPGEQVLGAGWRLADVVYEQSAYDAITSVFYAFSHSSSGTELYPDIKVFFYPEFNIVRLDGQLWRCERTARCTWTIKEKVGDATEAEWDGVGYEKE